MPGCSKKSGGYSRFSYGGAHCDKQNGGASCGSCHCTKKGGAHCTKTGGAHCTKTGGKKTKSKRKTKGKKARRTRRKTAKKSFIARLFKL